MTIDSADRAAHHVAAVERAMLAEVDRCRWDPVPQLRGMLETQIRRGGKRLRPLLALAFTDLYGGAGDEVVVPSASVEFYHLASIILDDVQDNSAVRRGEPALHTTASTSIAINVSALTRSLSYHPIHRCERLAPARKLRLHRELDLAATHLVLGQSIDIGWNGGWYAAGEFPYQDMVRWKTGALFGCAAAMAAVVCGADDAVDAARDVGIGFGSLFQGVDDYLDTFGDGQALHRPRFEDLRGGKLTAPLLCLLDALRGAGRTDDAEFAVRILAERTAAGQDWLINQMDRYFVAELVRADLGRQAAELHRLLRQQDQCGTAGTATGLIDRIMARVGIDWRATATGSGSRR